MVSTKYIITRIGKIKKMMDIFIPRDLSWIKKTGILLDLFLCIIIYGCGITDYFQYNFYKRKHIDRNNFIVYRKRMRIARTFNKKDDMNYFDQKLKFNQTFTDYIGRDWLYMGDTDYKGFLTFINKHNTFIVKPNVGSGGLGVYSIKVDQENNLENLYKRLKSEKAIIEEVIRQNKELSEFNSSSVNTFRIVTLLCGNELEPRIITGNLRLGRKGKVADNFHHKGIVSLIDVSTGIVMTPAVDMDLNRYIVHPDSGKQIVGFKVPYWDKLLETCKNVAKVVPTVRYVGWDVAIGEDSRIFIVEGNATANPDITQVADQLGKWPLYKPFIKELTKNVKGM